jgi:hypothetical protein
MTGSEKFKLGILREDFNKVLLALSIIRKKGKEDWVIYDVIHRLITDSNTFYVINENDIAIFVATPPKLWCWGLYSENGHTYEYYLPEFKEFAIKMGFTSLNFNSARPAYRKIFKKLGGEIVRTEYEIKL